MNGLLPEKGLTEADLEFLDAHVRDAALASGLDFGHLPWTVAAMRDACLTLRHVEGGRIRAVAIAYDRGVEREIAAVAVQPGARHRGHALRLLDGLVRPHVAASPKHRCVASVWPGVPDGAGVLLRAEFETSAGAVRFERDAAPLKPEGEPPPFRWIEAELESDEKRRRLTAAAAAAYPADADLTPTLTSLGSAANGFLSIGFAGNDARVAAAGLEENGALRITTLYAAETLKDHVAAEHLMARLVEKARKSGLRKLVIESARPTPRTVQRVFRLGFRAVEAAAGFRLGPIPTRTPPHVFAV
ncbi:MAG TPA: hypothetical protein VEI02_00375 [Planctomycetota bacterium]|nr:hypothetical protein [Planctomycetota bacterium]